MDLHSFSPRLGGAEKLRLIKSEKSGEQQISQLHPQPSWQPWRRPVRRQGAEDRGVTLPWEDWPEWPVRVYLNFLQIYRFCVIYIDKTVLCLVGGGGTLQLYFPKSEDRLAQTETVQALKVSSAHFHFLKCNSHHQTQFKTTKGIFCSDTKRSQHVSRRCAETIRPGFVKTGVTPRWRPCTQQFWWTQAMLTFALDNKPRKLSRTEDRACTASWGLDLLSLHFIATAKQAQGTHVELVI